RRRHTRFSRDWSSDVCSSDLKVNKILREHDLKPHKVEYWCGKSTDPEFESKMLNIVGLYLNPPENAIVLCIDEKTQIQALDRTRSEEHTSELQSRENLVCRLL